MSAMVIFHSLSGKKEEIVKPKGRALHMFVCGPTVYDFSHLGHARTYIAFDAIVRFLRSQKWDVFYLQNVTDVDDKIIARAREEKIDPLALAKKFFRAYLSDMKKIGVISTDTYAPATKHIPAIVRQAETLIQKGFAYKISDGYYFDISKFPQYGALSHRTVSQADDGVSRIDEGIEKKNKGDFCLWKFPKDISGAIKFGGKKKYFVYDSEPLWNTTLGIGRPGWHIEDTAISETYFGSQYDIHGGGIDLKFPHHEAEIAQQESASGKTPFVRYWMHTGFLLIEGKKMSKSLHNFITIGDFLKIHSAETLRYLVLSSHYRSPFDYSELLVSQAIQSLDTITRFFLALSFRESSKAVSSVSEKEVTEIIQKFESAFISAMEDDFNTPLALASIYEVMNAINKRIFALSPKSAAKLKYSIRSMLLSIGLDIQEPKIPGSVRALAKKRDLSRVNKQFMQSDALRNEIHALGYKGEDTPIGTLLSPSKIHF